MFNRIVVKAAFDCITLIEDDCASEPMQIYQGDTGIMHWYWPKSRYVPEPKIIWDKDQKKIPRGVLFENLEFVGLEQDGHRVIVAFSGS